MLATAAVFIVPILVHGADHTDELVPLAVGVVVLGLVAVRIRAIVARRAGATISQRSWVPGLTFGLAACLFAPWAPLPVVQSERDLPRVHAAAPLTLGIVSIVLFLQAAVLELPLLRSLAAAALVMVASVLLPVHPLDGDGLRTGELVVGAGLVGAAVLIGLGVAG